MREPCVESRAGAILPSAQLALEQGRSRGVIWVSDTGDSLSRCERLRLSGACRLFFDGAADAFLGDHHVSVQQH
jgi:hypothetical protein